MGVSGAEGRWKGPWWRWTRQDPRSLSLSSPPPSQASYAVSFLMVAVYAYESHRTVLGGRAGPPAALQVRASPGHSRDRTGERGAIRGSPFPREFGISAVPAELRPPLQPRLTAVLPQERSRCLESAWQGIPYVLAW